MNKYKICVYAICKNESKFVKRWVESMKEADEIYVLDTGSEDNTRDLLESLGVHVYKKTISPWRFDTARNESLKLVPSDCDICVCTDLDEVFESGWRAKLENIWEENITRLAYNYNWKLDKNNKPEINFYIEKIHSRKGYTWKYPVHEILVYEEKNEKIKTTDDITLNHYPDSKKSRKSYLKLLEISVQENSEDDRNMHYLGREYMYYKKWNKSIDTLIKHLNLKNAVWKDERCASMRFISRCYQNLGRFDEARMWLDKAIQEAPYLRDPYMEKALLEYRFCNWNEVIKYCLLALTITTHQKTYINEIFSWNNTVYDLLSIGYYELGDYEKSYQFANKALNMDPKDKRIKKNIKIIKQKLKK